MHSLISVRRVMLTTAAVFKPDLGYLTELRQSKLLLDSLKLTALGFLQHLE